MSANQTKSETPVFYGITTLARKSGLSFETVAKRMNQLGIEADGVLVRAGQSTPIFAASRLATLRVMLNNPQHHCLK